MSRPTDETGFDTETVSLPNGDSLQRRMRQFVADNENDIDLKTARQIETDGKNLSTVVIDERDERV